MSKLVYLNQSNMISKNKKMTKMIKFLTNNLWAIIPIILTIVGFTYAHIQNKRNNTLEDKLNKLNYSPQLVVTECKITDFNINRLATTQYTVTAETKLKNIGNNNAHLMMNSCAVLPTGEDYFRNLKDSSGFSKDVKDAARIYFADGQIYPNQELNGPTIKSGINKDMIVTGLNSIDVKEELLPTDSIFTIHFWFVYSNDNEIVYDTYYWYTTKITDDPKNPVKFVSQSYSFHIYDSNESKKIVADYKLSKSLKRSYISF